MNKQDFAKGIKVLELSYNQKFDEDKRDFWYRQLQDLSKDKFFGNIKQHVRCNQYMPNIAQIRGENKTVYANFEQRDYSNIDFDKLIAENQNHIPYVY